MRRIKEAFSLPLLGTLWHSDETKKILKPYAKERKQSHYVREAILKFANKKGFKTDDTNHLTKKPLYLTSDVWKQIKSLQQKSYYVDYTFLVAFLWLQQRPEFDGYNRSKLIREIIEDTSNHHHL